MIDITKPCDFDPFKPPNKYAITIVYETLKLTKHKLASPES
jgi:hypothetical protein